MYKTWKGWALIVLLLLACSGVIFAKKLAAGRRNVSVHYVYDWSQGANLKDWDTSLDPVTLEDGALVFKSSNNRTSKFLFRRSVAVKRVAMEFSVDKREQAFSVFVGQNSYRLHMDHQTIGYDRLSLARLDEIGRGTSEPQHEVLEKFQFRPKKWYRVEIVIGQDIAIFRIDGADILRAKAGPPGEFALLIEQAVPTRFRRIELYGKRAY